MNIQALYSEATDQATDMGRLRGLLAGINGHSQSTLAPSPVNS